MPSDMDMEKGLLTGVVGKDSRRQYRPRIDSKGEHDLTESQRWQRRQENEGRRRSWRFLGFAFAFFCLCLVIVGIERKSLKMSAGSLWTNTAQQSPSAVQLPSATVSQHEATIVEQLDKLLMAPTPSAAPADEDAHKGMKMLEPTAALRKLAAKLHQAIPRPTWTKTQPAAAAPTHEDQVLLLLSAAKQALYKFPSDVKQRLAELQPPTLQDFEHMLRKVMPSGTEEADARLYADGHDAWVTAHTQQTPLIVFSKSYCPYSRKAKALLRSMGARFEAIEVDLREDAYGLQAALREISGHATFPAVFLGHELLGGSDDLAEMHASHALEEKLKAAGVMSESAAEPTPTQRDVEAL